MVKEGSKKTEARGNRFPRAFGFFTMQEISLCDISGITTKAACGASLMNERHVRIKIRISLYALFSFGGESGSSADARSGHVFLFFASSREGTSEICLKV